LTEIWIRLASCQPPVRNPKPEDISGQQHQATEDTESTEGETSGRSVSSMAQEIPDFERRVLLLAEVEDLIHGGIDCGALPDPWNILGFQGMFPLSAAQEDSIRDPRIDDLTHVMENVFDSYTLLMTEAASAGAQPVVDSLRTGMKRLAAW